RLPLRHGQPRRTARRQPVRLRPAAQPVRHGAQLMALTATDFVPLGPIRSADLQQFVNLFTGVMTDQPVTFKNALTLGSSQAPTVVPLKIYGAVGQTGDRIDLSPDPSNAQPTFGLAANGRLAWGPGATSTQDTFVSRIGTQNGHSTDTAGLLVQ